MNQIDRAKYIKRLEVAAANHREINTQQREFYERVANNNIAPVRQYSTTAEELEDRALQRDKAFTNLQKITNSRDAGIMLNELQEAGEIDAFNRFFTPFFKELRGQSNISPIEFTALWTRYKEKLATTANTGILFTDPADEKQKRDELLVELGEVHLRSSRMDREGRALARFNQLADPYNSVSKRGTRSRDIKNLLDSLMDDAQWGDEEKSGLINIHKDDGTEKLVKLSERMHASGPYYVKPTKKQQVREIVFREFGVHLPRGGGLKTKKKTKKQKKMDLLEGIIMSGNNNPILAEELRQYKR